VNRIAGTGFGFALLVLALTALFTPHPVTPTHSIAASTPIPPAAREPVALPNDDSRDDADEEMDAIIDLYGNDVSSAVATYSLDALGSLYEEHSPQTELPRLGSPKT
jgi:hypothetical protein